MRSRDGRCENGGDRAKSMKTSISNGFAEAQRRYTRFGELFWTGAVLVSPKLGCNG